MLKKLYVLILVLGLCVGLNENHKWELAVAIGNQIELLASNGTLIGLAYQQFKKLKALAFDDVRHQFILSDMDDIYDTIYRIDLRENKEPTAIVADLPDDVKDIAVEETSNAIYWTDNLQKRILWRSLADPDSETQTLFQFSEEKPTGITVDNCARKLYWTNSNRPGATIERSNLDRTEHEIIISQNIFMPTGITIDQSAKRLYWSDSGEGIYFRIESSNLDGSRREIIYTDTHHQPYGIAVSMEMIYWTDMNNNALWGLRKGTKEPKMLREFPEEPMGLVIRPEGGERVCSDLIEKTVENVPNAVETFEPASDSVKCLNSGELTEHGCRCKSGYAGARCEIDLCHNFCVNGACKISPRGYPQCKCSLGFHGQRCEYEICKDFCLNGGTCRPDPRNETLPVTCDCPLNFSGRRCERVDDIEALCSLICDEGQIQILSIDETQQKCKCANKLDAYKIVNKNATNCQPAYLVASIGSQFTERFKDPVVVASWSLSALLLITIIGLIIALIRMRFRRPRIKKRIIVNKNVTPLTYRPGQSTEQCEITIENCCNMNICETPCFEPKKLEFPPFKKNEEKKTLLTSMENGEDIY